MIDEAFHSGSFPMGNQADESRNLRFNISLENAIIWFEKVDI